MCRFFIFQDGTLSSSIKFKYIIVLNLIILEKENIVCILLVYVTRYLNLIGKFDTMMPKQLFLNFVIFLVPIYHNESHAIQWKQYLILFIFEFFDILMILHKHITNLQQLYNTNTTKQYSSKYYHLSNFHKHIRNTNLDLWWFIMGRRLGLEWRSWRPIILRNCFASTTGPTKKVKCKCYDQNEQYHWQ